MPNTIFIVITLPDSYIMINVENFIFLLISKNNKKGLGQQSL